MLLIVYATFMQKFQTKRHLYLHLGMKTVCFYIHNIAVIMIVLTRFPSLRHFKYRLKLLKLPQFLSFIRALISSLRKY